MRVPMLLCAVLLSGCGDGIATVSIDYEDTATIAGGGIVVDLIGSLGFDGFLDMNVVEAEELQNQGVEPGDIVAVSLTVLELEALSPDGADLSFVDVLDVSVASPSLPEASVASQDQFPVGAPLVALDLVDIDLTEYVVSESLTLEMDVTGTLPPEDTRVRAYMEMDIRVTVQGLANQARSE